MIKNFAITGLFGDRDVAIPFDSNVKILVAENGTGKTTVLNTLYNTVAGDFARIRGLEFQKISVAFSNGTSIELTKDQVESMDNFLPDDPRVRNIIAHFGHSVVQEVFEMAKRMPPHQVARNPRFAPQRQRLGMSVNEFQAFILHLTAPRQGDLQGITLKGVKEAIEKGVTHELLYFPTYRRVEEDLERLGFGGMELPASDQLIKFGMNDVRELFEKITSEIKNSSILWFSKINGQMLTQLIDGINVTQQMRKEIESPEALKIVLDRIGENIGEGDKKHILDLVKNKKLDDERYDPLTYFLTNLIKVYDQQRENDNAIKEFSAVCNKYLGDKEVIYNESRVSIEVLRKKNGEPISIGKLSSGEKQIISLFSKLYLDTSKSAAVFFDEPELSLSIEWQKQLLPHVVESKRCAFLVATTHSPFIFENDLDSKTTDLTQFINYR